MNSGDNETRVIVLADTDDDAANTVNDADDVPPPLEDVPTHEQVNKPATVCLAMIVRDEEKNIERALRSAARIIDYYVIFDTGSVDATVATIERVGAELGIPGEVHHSVWTRDYAFHRNQGLEIAKTKCDYVLILDADEEFHYADDWVKPVLGDVGYFIKMVYPDFTYDRCDLVRSDAGWSYKGSLHEVMSTDARVSKPIARLAGIWNTPRMEGFRSTNPHKYMLDALHFRGELLADPTNPRSTFYCAQSYRDAKHYKQAEKWYKRRATMGGFPEEVALSMMEVGTAKRMQGAGFADYAGWYLSSYGQMPVRLEALFQYVTCARAAGMPHLGYNTGVHAVDTPYPASCKLFVIPSLYNGNFKWEIARCAAESGNFARAEELMLQVEKMPDVPPHIARGSPILRQILSTTHDQAAQIIPDHNTFFVALMVDPRVPLTCLALECAAKQLGMRDDADRAARIKYALYVRGPTVDADVQAWADTHSASVALFEDSETGAGNAREAALADFLETERTHFVVVHTWCFACPLVLHVAAAMCNTASNDDGLGVHGLMLKSLMNTNARYSCFFDQVDDNGYYVENARYLQIVSQMVAGVFDVGAVFGLYAMNRITAGVIARAPVSDAYEPVTFANHVRAHDVPIRVVNVGNFGRLIRPGVGNVTPADALAAARENLKWPWVAQYKLDA